MNRIWADKDETESVGRMIGEYVLQQEADPTERFHVLPKRQTWTKRDLKRVAGRR